MISAKGQSTIVTFDGRVITITRGFMAQGGKGTATYALDRVNGIELRMPGLAAIAGRFTIVTGGGVQQRRTAGFSAATRDPLTVTFTARHKAEFQALADAVNAALAVPRSPTVQADMVPSDGLAQQLERLAALRGDGVLTDDEFTAAKSRLLGGA